MSQPENKVITKGEQVKPFYVYVHRRATDGRVFYVGKGKGGRVSTNFGRNRYWHHIVRKHGFTHHIVIRFEKEECAFSFEKALIKHYGRENLCNMTDGGDGQSGLTHSKDTLKLMSKAQSGYSNPRYDPTKYLFSHKDNGIVTCSKYEFRMLTGAGKTNIRNLVNGKSKTVFGWVCHGNARCLEVDQG